MTKQSLFPLPPFFNHHCLSNSVPFVSYSIQSSPESLMPSCRGEMEVFLQEKKRWTIPKLGNWEYFDEMSITHCFDSGSKPGLIRTSFFGDEGLYKLPVTMPAKSSCPFYVHCHRQFLAQKSNGVGLEKLCSKEQQQRNICNVTAATPSTRRAPMAVDEDLYKIPPGLLYTKPKRERMLRNLLWGCMGGLNCIR